MPIFDEIKKNMDSKKKTFLNSPSPETMQNVNVKYTYKYNKETKHFEAIDTKIDFKQDGENYYLLSNKDIQSQLNDLTIEYPEDFKYKLILNNYTTRNQSERYFLPGMEDQHHDRHTFTLHALTYFGRDEVILASHYYNKFELGTPALRKEIKEYVPAKKSALENAEGFLKSKKTSRTSKTLSRDIEI